MNKLIQEIDKLFTKIDTIYLSKIFIEKLFLKGEYILKPGQNAYYVFFIEKGITRNFLYRNDKEITLQFNFKDEIAIPLNSFDYTQKSDEYIQALNDTIITKINLSEFDKLKKNNSEIKNLEEKFVETYVINIAKRLRDFQTLDARERYLKLLKTEPKILQFCKLTHIASYLGISLVSLSRIRSKII